MNEAREGERSSQRTVWTEGVKGGGGDIQGYGEGVLLLSLDFLDLRPPRRIGVVLLSILGIPMDVLVLREPSDG